MNHVPVGIFIFLILFSVDGLRNLHLHAGAELEKGHIFTRWFNQSLDHFDAGNLATWQQRYDINEEFFDRKKRNVAFLLIGGEYEVDIGWLTSGEWYIYANESNALIFQLEHRFFGKSQPTDDLSIGNLRYLTSQQALADLATFVATMNHQYDLSKEVKWIVFGGSYPGALAAWARLKYPHLIHGAISTSGPLLAITNFPDYYLGVAKAVRKTNKECYKAIVRGTAQIDPLLQHLEGQRTLTQLFQLCSPLENSVSNKHDISNFFENLANNFAAIAQYNKDNRLSLKGTLLGDTTLDTLCSIMTNTSLEQEIARLAEVNSLIRKAFNESCFDFRYQSLIEKNNNVSNKASDRQWKFLTCNEFGYFQTSDKTAAFFGDKFPLEIFVQQCIDLFGSKFDAKYVDYATHRTNTMYGAYNIKVSNVVFVHGSMDPWSALGLKTTKNHRAPAIFIKGTAHCANMYQPSKDDLPQLKAARVQIRQIIHSWLHH